MKAWLIRYDTANRQLLSCDEIAPIEMRAARIECDRLEFEEMRDKSGIEVLILESDSLETLHRTHASYFKTPAELLERLGRALQGAK